MALKHGIGYSKIYDCGNCDYKQKRKRGCKKSKRKSVAMFDCFCHGNKLCKICKGRGTFKWYRCPRTVLFDNNIERTISYFYNWIGSDCRDYPNGKGLYYQPLKLVDAFDLLFCEYQKYKELEIKNGK